MIGRRDLVVAFGPLALVVGLGASGSAALGAHYVARVVALTRRIALRRKECAEGDKLTARLLAQSGISRALVAVRDALRRGEKPPEKIERAIGARHAVSGDAFHVDVRRVEGLYEIDSRGVVLEGDGEKVAAQALIHATARITADSAEVQGG